MPSLKNIIGDLLSPTMICLFLLVAGGVLLWRDRKGLGRVLIGTGLTLLLIFSNRAVADLLIRSLEQDYPPATATSTAECQFIAVLGGGHGNDTAQPWTNRLAGASLARLVEAVRLARLNPHAKLIFCGPVLPNNSSHAVALAGAAAELGLDPQRFILFTEVHDTHDEVLAIRAEVGLRRVALVTSAWHLPRAMSLAGGAGLNAVACPADYLSPNAGTSTAMWAEFGLSGLGITSRATREYLGIAWTALRGQR